MPKKIAPLSDIQLSKAKAKESDYKLADGGGLYLFITTTGGKLWRMDYRFNDKRKTTSFGSYPIITLADARQRREDAKKLLVNGVDPAEMKKSVKQAKTALKENSFEIVAREWHSKFSGAGKWSNPHAVTIINRLERDVFPWMGNRPIIEIKAPELLTVLHRIEKRGALDSAHRVRHYCGQIFRYAIATGRAERNIAADLQGALPPVKGGHFAAPTDPKAVATILRAIDGFEGSFIVKCALQLAPMLFVRPGELRAAEWSEIDLEAFSWNIPAERMKMKIAHLVPLSRQAVEILKALQPLTGHSRYVFPCQRTPLRCMSENAVNAGLRRMGFEKSEITGHGFRAMARTILDEVLQIRPDFIEHQLAHAVKDPNGRAYNRTAHLMERKKMMQTWADYLDGLKQGAKVIPIRPAEAA